VTIKGTNTSIQSARIRITATDIPGDSDTKVFNIYVTSSPPIIPNLNNIDAYLANEILGVTYTIVSESSSSNLSLSLILSDGSNIPSWLNIVYNDDKTFTISGNPTSNLGDVLTVVVTVNDSAGNSSSENSFIVTVKQYVVGNTSIQMDTNTISKFDTMTPEQGEEIVTDFIASSIGEDPENIEIISFTVNTGGTSLLQEHRIVHLVTNATSSPSLDVVYKVKTDESDDTIKQNLESNGNAAQMVTSFNTVADNDVTIESINETDAEQLEQNFTTETTTVTDTTNADATGIPLIRTAQNEIITNQDDVIVSKTLHIDVAPVNDTDGIQENTRSYAWIRKDNQNIETIIDGVSTTSYTLTDDDIGYTIAIRYTFEDIYGYETILTTTFTQFIVMKKYDIAESSTDHSLVGIGQDATLIFTGVRSISDFNTDRNGYDSFEYDTSITINEEFGYMGLWIGPHNGDSGKSIYYSSKIDDTTKTIELKQGWNLLGVSQDSSIQDTDNIIDDIYMYNNKEYELVDSILMMAHEGYMVYCNKNGNINILSANSSSGT